MSAAAATMSAIESQAPTSWNATSLDGDAVHPRLRLREMREDRDRVLAHRRREIGTRERIPDLGPRPMVVAVVARVGMGVGMGLREEWTVRVGMRVIVMAVLAVAVLVPVRGMRRGVWRAGSGDQEAAALEDAVVVGQHAAGDARPARGAYARRHALGVLGEGVEEGGDEHVAGHAADRVEVDLHACPMVERARGPSVRTPDRPERFRGKVRRPSPGEADGRAVRQVPGPAPAW